MKIQVRYFAALREALGPGEWLEMPAGTTVDELREVLRSRSPAHAGALGGRPVRAALNQALCDGSTTLTDAAEVAFFPPVTGG
jgi:molybdopterin synthase sulfur carrier subunit